MNISGEPIPYAADTYDITLTVGATEKTFIDQFQDDTSELWPADVAGFIGAVESGAVRVGRGGAETVVITGAGATAGFEPEVYSVGLIALGTVTTVGSGSGSASATTIPDGSDAALGTTTDLPSANTEDATSRTGISLLKGIKNALTGTTTTKVITDAAGTIQQYLRGLIHLAITGFKTDMVTLIAGEDQTLNRMRTLEAWNYTNITTATTTVIKNAPGIFGGIVFNKRIANGVVTVYDNTAASGAKIGTITEGAAILNDPPQGGPIYKAVCGTGITIVTSQAEDLTVLWL